ncbi:MAG: DUF2064 domain-containing protein, partial [Gemmatimonadetes bacterium]|nr:DUF2064 domain-containing protein [Gemmatimonadota bacterium]
GSQLRAGADEASGRWLLFLHADCRMDDSAVGALNDFLATADESEYAHFDFALNGDAFFHRFIEFGQDLRERGLGLVYGDQGLVVSRSLYDAVEGYPDWPLMEDVGILRRLEVRGRRVALPATLVTSDRRYAEEGGTWRWLRNVLLMTLFHLGVSPSRLGRWYRPRRHRRAAPSDRLEAGTTRVVGVFAKAPVPGRVKTRLAADVGDLAAVEIYRTLGRMTVDALRGGDYRLVVFGTPADSASLTSIAHWLGPEDIEVHPQPDGDLGHRMARAVEHALDDAQAVVIVGTDIPGIDEETVDEAFRLLRDHDVVVGPATDGGYYLVGLTRPRPELFAGIEWSTPRVLPQTLERIAARRLTVALLTAKSDVDTADDLTESLRTGMPGGA